MTTHDEESPNVCMTVLLYGVQEQQQTLYAWHTCDVKDIYMTNSYYRYECGIGPPGVHQNMNNITILLD